MNQGLKPPKRATLQDLVSALWKAEALMLYGFSDHRFMTFEQQHRVTAAVNARLASEPKTRRARRWMQEAPLRKERHMSEAERLGIQARYELLGNDL